MTVNESVRPKVSLLKSRDTSTSRDAAILSRRCIVVNSTEGARLLFSFICPLHCDSLSVS